MNPNRLLYDIKTELGIGTFIQTSASDYQLLSIIEHKARMIFSRIYACDLYIPHITFSEKDRYNSRYLGFRLPQYILNEIQFEHGSIVDVRYFNPAPADCGDSIHYDMAFSPSLMPAGTVDGGYWNNFYTAYQPQYYQQGMSTMLGMLQAGMSMEYYRKPLKVRFRAPDCLEFDPRGMNPYEQDFELRLKVSHPRSLYTIDEAHYYIFKKLCIFDIQEFLWNNELKGLEGLSNGYDNISLKIDDWAEASSRRDEYIRELEQDIVLMEGISAY